MPPERERILYPPEALHSPIPTQLAERLRTIALHGQGLDDAVFMKVGDSITASSYFFSCLDGDVNAASPSWSTNIHLGGRRELADAIFHFRSAPVGRATSFSRESRAARGGQPSGWALSGLTPPLEIEFGTTRAQFAVVMYGTNDLSGGGSATAALETKIGAYPRNLLAITDWLLARGVVPVLSTIPPRNDEPEYLGLAPVMNAAVRAVAQGRQVPLVDYHQSLLPLLELGLSGDGVHPNIENYNTGCDFTEAGLGWGYNQRNLVTLQGLERVMRVVVDGVPQLDAPGRTLAGQGTEAAPFVIPSLPFSELRTSEGHGVANTPCVGSRPMSGSQVVYDLRLERPTRVRAAVLSASLDGGAELDLHLQQDTRCVAMGDTTMVTRLEAGTWRFVVDQPSSDAGTAEFVFLVVPCSDDDRLCAALAP